MPKMLHHTDIPTNIPTDPDIAAIQERVRGFVRRLVADPHDGEEVVSQTLLALIEGLRTRRSLRKPDAWALRVAWNKVVDLRRRERRSVEQGPDVVHLPAPDARRNRELREWLDAGLSCLPEADRALLHLRYAEEMSDREIARVLGCPRGTVAWRLHEARRRLGEALERLGGGVSVVSVLTLMGALGSRTQAAVSVTLAPATVTAGVLAGAVAMKKVVALVVAVVVLGFLAWRLQDVEPGTGAGRDGGVAFAENPADDMGPAGGTPSSSTASDALDTAPYEEPSAAPARGVFGRVETAEGIPVAGARVLAFTRASGMPIDLDDEQAPLFRGVTGSDGRFAIPVTASGRFDLVARTDTHAPAFERDVPLNQDIVITLDQAVEIRGLVVDLKGDPVAGAKVSYRSLLGHVRFQRSVQTGPDGRFVVTGLYAYRGDGVSITAEPQVSHHILVEAEGYASRRKPLTGMPEDEIVIHVSRGAVVEGRVTAQGAPVDGAEVVLWTNEDPPPAAPRDEAVWIRNPFGSRIVLRTHTDSEGRYRLAGVPVQIAGINPVTSFKLQLPDGTGSTLGGVVAWKPGFAPGSAPARLPVHEDEVQVADLVLHPPARLEGRVVDEDGTPMPGVRVRPSVPGEPAFGVAGSPEPLGRWVETDAEGRWRFDHVPCPGGRPTPCVLQCCGCPLGLGQDNTLQIEAIPGETVQVGDIQFNARRVHGRVENTVGEPVEGASVRLQRKLGLSHPPASGSAAEFQSKMDELKKRTAWGVFTGSDGTFALWRMTADGKSAADGLEVVAATYRTTGAPIPEDGSWVTVVLEPAASIEGRLCEADGTPARSILLRAWPASAPKPERDLLSATTGEDGRFVFGGLAPGGYVVATDDALGAERWQTTAQADGPDVHGVLPSSSSGPPTYELALRIVQAWDRAPVISAQVTIAEDGDRPQRGFLGTHRQTPGLYIFPKLRAGTHTMTVDAPGFAPLTRQVTVGPAGSMEPLEILLGAGTQLSGRVHFPPDIEVYQQTTVTVFGSESNEALGTADVAPDGTYSLAGIPKGSILIRADAPALGRDGATRPALTVARLVPLRVDDGPRVCDLDLVPAVRLDVHFTRQPPSPKDAAPPGISAGGVVKDPNALEAFLLDAEGRPWKAIDAWRQTMDLPSSGNTHRVWHLPPGRYTVGVRKGDAILCEVRVTAPGRTTLALPDP